MKYVPLIYFLTSILAIESIKADSSTENVDEISKLLIIIRTSNIYFERNGNKFSAAEAASHLERKIESASKFWFAPDREKWTAEMFIERLASQSSMSGKPYFVIKNDGVKVPSKIWLTEKLKQLRRQTNPTKK